MNKKSRNYDQLMEEALIARASSQYVPSLFLHACCAPCSSAVLERLSPHFRITVYYYNPNIFPEEEYRRRVAELKRLVSECEYPNPVEILEGAFDPERFFECAKGLENEPEGGARCEKCFRLRLREAAQEAAARGFDYVTTTLTISPQKDVDLLNRIGEEEAEKAGVQWLPSAFRKKGGYQRSIELSKEHGLYRQDFCGCVYSKAAREKEKRAGRSEGTMDTDCFEKRCFTVIDLNALKENLMTAKRLAGPDMKVIAVVKANSYGLGAVSVARTLLSEVWGFAVATFTEAVELRDAGIKSPVMILSMIPENCYQEAIRLDIRPTFYDDESLKAFSEEAARLGKTALYHLAVDTGMTRIGLFPDEEGLRTALRMAEMPNTRAEGIYTHLATMDEDDPSRAIWQMASMKAFVKRLQEAGLGYEMIHAANSAATLLRGGFAEEGIFNACRYGISLYGAYPSEIEAFKSIPIRPVLSWYGRITRIAVVPAGTEVGYGGTFVTERKMRIATIAAGYADGYPRSLSSKGEVLIRGKRCRILGRVCMDQFMVDADNVPEVKSGEFAVLLGRDGTEEITVEELSERSGRFPYELFSLITPRVPRIVKE